MRDYHLQTPQKDFSVANRRMKSVVDHNKKLKKVGKKSLISEFSAVVEDASALNSPKDSVDLSTLSELYDETQLMESAENLIASVSPSASPASEALASSGLTSLSSTSDEYKNLTVWGSPLSGTMKQSCIEAELAINHLKLAQREIWNAGDMDLQSKKLLDSLVNVIIEDFQRMPEEKERFNEQNFSRAYVVCLSFLLWILAVSAAIFCFSGSKHAFRGATPT